MGSLTRNLFGGSKSTPSQQQNQSGFIALPQDLQDYYRGILSATSNVAADPNQYFRPADLSATELQARDMMNPENIQGSIQKYLNPFQSRIEEDINRQFRAPQSALTQRASEAGAFGGSRQREGEADLERARLDAMAGASANQYNNAYNQLQAGIQQLLGFGGFERDLDLQQRQATPSALGFASEIFAPLLGTSSGTSIGANTKTTSGAVNDIAKIGGLFSSIFSPSTAAVAASDIRIKENIVRVGEENGYPIYEFNYINKPEIRYSGVMAQDVEKIMPEAVVEKDGIKMVDYAMIGLEMREVAC